jgi:prepilin-type N-terminal cleavage/methylation domain-containing protein
MRKESGFTIMELMVTIAIILIMASIVVPTFLSWLPRQRHQGEPRLGHRF